MLLLTHSSQRRICTMKKFILFILVLAALVAFCSCTSKQDSTDKATTETKVSTEATTEKIYKDSKFLGKWYNTFSKEAIADFELNADGSAIYKGKTKGKWTDNGDDIIIKMKIDGEYREMKGYFVIAGDGFVARATPENQHYLDEGKGELQLEIMLTENTCIDCVKE